MTQPPRLHFPEPTHHISGPGTGGRHKHNRGVDINSSRDGGSQSLRTGGGNQGKTASGEKDVVRDLKAVFKELFKKQ